MDNPNHPVISTIYNVFTALMLIAVLLALKPVSKTIGIIEGTFFPVTTPLIITDVRADPRGMGISGQAIKTRDCDYRSVDWRYGRPGNNVPITGGFDDPPAVNELPEDGDLLLKWEGIWNEVHPESVGSTLAYTWHQCPGRWWQTRTLWNPGAAGGA